MESKKLGFWSIVLLGINGIIGSGIFLLPNKAMAIIGPASLLVMLFDMLLVLAITFCFAEASGLFKENGGAYIYAKEAFGDFIGYEVGFLSWATRIIAFSTMSVGFATALGGLIPSLNTVMMKNIIISVIFIVLAVINLLGIKLYEVIQNLATIAKILPFILFIGMGIFYIEPVNFTPLVPNGVYTPGSFGAAAVMLFFAFTGFESLAVAAAEAAGTLISIGALCIASSFITPHSGLALAEQHMLPAFMAKRNRFGAPYWCIIVSTIVAMLIGYTGGFAFLASISVVSRFSQYIPTCLSIMVFRKKMPDAPRVFKIPFGPVIPVIALLVSFWLLAQAKPQQLLIGFGAAIVALPFYFLVHRKK